MTPGIPKESVRHGEVERETPRKRAADKKRESGNQVLALDCGRPGASPRGDESKPGTESVHVIEKIQRVGDRENPQHREKVSGNFARDEQRDANSAPGHE